MATLTGEVLGERTILNFPNLSENPRGDHVIQQHIGRMDHATGYQTQLQFNLYPTQEHGHNSIVNHPPRPPPVVIERMGPQCMSTHDKMEVAALLARRDFRNGRLPTKLLSAEQSESSLSSEEDEASEAEQIIPVQPKIVKVAETVRSDVPPMENHPHIGSQEKNSDTDKMASEIVSLRRQLRRQVSRLREAVHIKKTSRMTVKDEDDIERELRREDGKGVRSMQSLYALQQQVQKLKSELDQHQKVSTTVRDTKKSLAMKQLAATHRSTIRLLHSFAGIPGRPVVYQQLSELMHQLTLCCCQLGLDRAQLLELNDQIKALEKEIVELNKNEEELAAITRLRQQQVQQVRKPTRGPPPRRQQRHRNYASVWPNDRRSGHFKAQTFSSLMRKQAPVARSKTKQPSPSQKHKRPNVPSKFTSLPPQAPPVELVRPMGVKPAGERRLTFIPTTKKQRSKRKKGITKKQHGKLPHSGIHKDSNNVRAATSLQSPDEDKRDSPNTSDEDSSCDSESSTGDVVSLVNDTAMKNHLLSASTPKASSGHHDNNSPMIPLVSNSSNDDNDRMENLEVVQALQEMLVKLAHIEEEKMRIQQRWSNLTYHDPTVKPVVHVPCSPSPSPCSVTTLSVAPSMLQSASHYCDRFHHHLKLKGAITGLDWSSSELIEKISEDILDEIVDSTVNELDELCEQYAHNVYASEFAVPNSSI